MMHTPKVSIFIPNYNYALYLPAAIESVLNQDYEDFELIIADDASSDNSYEVIKSYADRDDRIRFYQHEKNKGMVENWNWCMEQARGEYIKPMLADDNFSQSYALRRMVDELNENSNISLVVSSRLLIDEAGNELGVDGVLGIRDRTYNGEKLIRMCLHADQNLIGEPTAVLFRKIDLKRFFEVSYRQLVDLEMWFYLLGTGNLVYLAEPLCCFRKHSNQQTEVNKKLGVGQKESLQLLAEYGGGIRKKCLFVRIYRMMKPGNEHFVGDAKKMRDELTSMEYNWFFFRYKIMRPFRNARASILKRHHRGLHCDPRRSISASEKCGKADEGIR